MTGRATRVAMVSASFFPHVGGAEKQALELSAALRARGAAVFVATRRLPGLAAEAEVRGVRVHRLWRLAGPLDAPTFLLSLAWFLWRRRADYDAIHVHLAGSPALAAALVGKLARKPVVVKLGGGAGIGELAVSSRSAAGRLKLRLLARLRPRLAAVARELADESRRFLGPLPVELIPNGVDVERYRPADAARRAALREKLGWPKGALVFLYVGRLSPEKRLPWFVEAWGESARRAGHATLFALVGDGSERGRIETAAAYARVTDKIRLVASTPDVADYYAAADVFVLPSISEGLSNALLEAMASGIATLASRVGGTPEAVEDGVSGLLFGVDEEAGLRERLDRLYQTPGLTAALGGAARRTAVERFSLHRTCEAYERLYRQ